MLESPSKISPYLPGFIADTVDGGMANPVTTTTKKTLVLGTAGQGPSGVAYPVTDPTQAAADFGRAGDLVQGMEEVRAYCDNITCYRLGTKAWHAHRSRAGFLAQ